MRLFDCYLRNIVCWANDLHPKANTRYKKINPLCGINVALAGVKNTHGSKNIFLAFMLHLCYTQDLGCQELVEVAAVEAQQQ